MGIKGLKRRLVGSPLSTEMLKHEKIPKWKGLAVLSSDALSSVAYATEEVLIPLALFATAAVSWSMPIALAIGALLFVVTISYRQTIDAYPNGGGAYTVAKDNLGVNAGLVAGAALLIDYVLTVSVSVAAGVENIASAFPSLLPHKVAIDIICIFVIMLLNLRGVRESANVFAIPTYLFIASFVVMIVVGFWRLAAGSAMAVAPVIHEVYPALPLFLLMRAFASGCVALTGIEAISNGIPIFKDPSQKNAKITMAWMSFILGSFFLAITLLSHLYGIIPREGETAVSLLARQVFGDSILYYLIPITTTLILILAANTSYADFPRLCSLLAKDKFLPRQLASLGDRLVFSNGIIGLSLSAALLIFIFQGDTHSLIPLYAVGVFLSFTLSQYGMILHHLRYRESGWKKGILFNGIGALTTALVLLIIGTTKFLHGAWVVILLIPAFVYFFKKIHNHYIDTQSKLLRPSSYPLQAQALKHKAIVPISGVHNGVIQAVSYALSISDDVKAIYVDLDNGATEALKKDWNSTIPNVPLQILSSPYRSVITPIVKYIYRAEREHPQEVITVIIPEFITPHWYHQFLHNQTALILNLALRGRKNIIVTSVRYHLDH